MNEEKMKQELLIHAVKLGMNKRELAAELHINEKTFYNWLAGQRISQMKLDAIQEYINRILEG